MVRDLVACGVGWRSWRLAWLGWAWRVLSVAGGSLMLGGWLQSCVVGLVFAWARDSRSQSCLLCCCADASVLRGSPASSPCLGTTPRLSWGPLAGPGVVRRRTAAVLQGPRRCLPAALPRSVRRAGVVTPSCDRRDRRGRCVRVWGGSRASHGMLCAAPAHWAHGHVRAVAFASVCVRSCWGAGRPSCALRPVGPVRRPPHAPCLLRRRHAGAGAARFSGTQRLMHSTCSVGARVTEPAPTRFPAPCTRVSPPPRLLACSLGPAPYFDCADDGLAD
jgi:hypothetical protein